MATISKFYLHDAATPNTGTMPTGAFLNSDATGDATGARTARDANGTLGTLQTSSVVTSNADLNPQSWGHRRFVSRPLAAQTVPFNSVWTFSYARAENNLLHNQNIVWNAYAWHPGTGPGQVGSGVNNSFGAEPTVAATEQAEAATSGSGGTSDVAISDGDILVIEVTTSFTQGMATAYTDTFYYDGTTEASVTSCATFLQPSAPLTLYTPSAAIPDVGMALTVT